MDVTRSESGDIPAFGRLLKRQRARRNLSQMALGSRAAVSARHISFLETGRSAPTRGMILRLAGSLNVSRRDTNALFRAAGYAPHYSEIDLEGAEADGARRVIDFLLRRHEPFSALAFDRVGNIVASNAAHRRLLDRLLPDADLPHGVRDNVLRLLLHPEALGRAIVNREEVVAAVLGRFLREAEEHDDDARRALYEELSGYDLPDVRPADLDASRPPLMITLHFRRDDLDVELITVVTTLGTAVDVTLSELRIETYFPANSPTEDLLRRLAAEEGDRGGPAVVWRDDKRPDPLHS